MVIVVDSSFVERVIIVVLEIRFFVFAETPEGLDVGQNGDLPNVFDLLDIIVHM